MIGRGSPLYPPFLGGNIPDMTTRYTLNVTIVSTVDEQGDPCVHCQLDGRDVEAQLYITDERGRRVFESACLACIIPIIDATPFVVDAVVVEVAHAATLRPF